MIDKTFVNGTLAEKARLATSLVSELLAELPDDLLYQHQQALNAGSKALLAIQLELRGRNKKSG